MMLNKYLTIKFISKKSKIITILLFVDYLSQNVILKIFFYTQY